jgi:hypothetical protein
VKAPGAAASPRRRRPLWQVLLDLASVALFVALWSALVLRVASGADALVLATCFCLALPFGLLVADLASGFVHWWADTFLDERTPVLGPLVVQPFRQHHRDPAAMAGHGFLEVSGNNGLVCAPALALALALPAAPLAEPLRAAAEVALLVAALAAFATNHFHKWAHSEPGRLPRPVAWLQRRRIILSPEQHALHHGGGHDCAYCVTTGWCNPVVDRLALFPRLTRLLRPRSR